MVGESQVDLGLKGKFALVTGGSHGIGRSIALSLAREGCNVAIVARQKPNIERVVGEIGALGARALGIEADLTDREQLLNSFETATAQFGGLHILINNVGGGGRWGSEDPLEAPESIWNESLEQELVFAI